MAGVFARSVRQLFFRTPCLIAFFADIGFEQAGFFKKGGRCRKPLGCMFAPSVQQLFLRTPCLTAFLPTTVLKKPVSSTRGSVQEASGEHFRPIGSKAVFKDPLPQHFVADICVEQTGFCKKGGVGAGSLWRALYPIGFKALRLQGFGFMV